MAYIATLDYVTQKCHIK